MRIDLEPCGEWRAPARLCFNVRRAQREFRNEPFAAPWDAAKACDDVYEVPRARGM